MQIAKLFSIIIGGKAASSDAAKNDNGDVTPLHDAAGWNNTAEAKRLIANGADVNAKTKRERRIYGEGEMTPLHFAAMNNQAEVAELLIANGADVNAKDQGGMTPLHTALQRAPEVAELLIANGADVNAKDNDGKTPLDQVALNKSAEWASTAISGEHFRHKYEEEYAARMEKLLIDNGATR